MPAPTSASRAAGLGSPTAALQRCSWYTLDLLWFREFFFAVCESDGCVCAVVQMSRMHKRWLDDLGCVTLCDTDGGLLVRFCVLWRCLGRLLLILRTLACLCWDIGMTLCCDRISTRRCKTWKCRRSLPTTSSMDKLRFGRCSVGFRFSACRESFPFARSRVHMFAPITAQRGAW